MILRDTIKTLQLHVFRHHDITRYDTCIQLHVIRHHNIVNYQKYFQLHVLEYNSYMIYIIRNPIL